MAYPESVRMVEVSPRDGLQHEGAVLKTAVKVELIERLAATGLPVVEATSFVRPDRIPQLADAEQVLEGLRRHPGVAYPVLVPNLTGLERAMAAGAREIAVFTAASERFCQRNTHCSIQESLARITSVLEVARERGLFVRAYVSCALGCPYEGPVEATRVAALTRRLHDLGCDETALGDTIGAGTPVRAQRMVETVAEQVPAEKLALHFHDTRGQALANILACLSTGVRTVDASVAGLGGCPYAEGASGNVATEDVIYMLEGMGIHTGVDLRQLVAVGDFISAQLGRPNGSRVAWAGVPEGWP